MIFPIWQPFASSSHRLAGKCGELLNEKATHTGTLDPMAEGVLVLLTGEDRLVKGSLSDWKKTYSFSIVWGVETDSGDKLGMIKNVDLAQATPQEFPIQKLKNLCANFPTEYLQTVPIFSAARYAGKSGFDWARENKNVPEKNTTVEIHTLENNGTIQISCEEILNEHQRLVSKVDGDFRQTAILENWQEKLTSLETELAHNFFITHHTVTVSNRTYIRQLVQDLAKQIGIVATTWSISRIQNGPFEKKDCLEINELEDLKIILAF